MGSMYHQIGLKSTNGQAEIITERETYGITIVSTKWRLQRGATLDLSSLGLTAATVQKSRPKMKPVLHFKSNQNLLGVVGNKV